MRSMLTNAITNVIIKEHSAKLDIYKVNQIVEKLTNHSKVLS